MPVEAPAPARPALPVLDGAPSPDPAVCPFLRLDTDGVILAPHRAPDEDHRCVAIAGPRAQSLQQQELVCLRAAHVDCPRYRRVAPGPRKVPRSPRRTPTVPRATLAALLVLVLSAGISFGFVLKRGGIDMPVVGSTPVPTEVAAVGAPSGGSGAATAAPGTQGPSAALPPPTTSPGTSTPDAPSVAPSASPRPTPTPRPTPRPTPKATRPTGTASASRLAVLTPCPGQAGCYVYTVRAGDNLFSIAHWFGVPLSTVYAWNPTVRTSGVHAGVKLRIPTPTR